MTNEPGTGSRLGRLAAEFAVIVVGILVALFAESAWQDRGERIEEGEALLRIREELAVDSFDLRNDELAYALTQQAAVEAGPILAGADTLPDARTLALLYGAALRMQTRSEQGTWQDLTSAGRSSLISNPELRRRLINFYSERERRDEVRRDTPLEYRTRVVSVLPLEFTSAVLACIRREEGAGSLTQGPREGGVRLLLECELPPDVDAARLVRRIRDVPDVDLALGELQYFLSVFGEQLDRARRSYDSLVVELDVEIEARR